MDATELARWKRFAAKGGIGSCTAIKDCVAEVTEDLMFYEDDEIVVLMPIEGQEGRYMGYCEGVVGRFSASDVRFHGKLKKVVITPRGARPSDTESAHQVSTSAASSITGRATPQASPEFVQPQPATANPVDTPVPIENPGPASQTPAQGPAPAPAPAPTETPNTIPDVGVVSPGTAVQSDVPASGNHPPTLKIPERGQIRESRSVVSALLQTHPFRSPLSPFESALTPSSDLFPTPTSTNADFFSPNTPNESRVTSMAEPSRGQSAVIDSDDADSRASMAFSDGEFGIGMQFIQGLVDQGGEGTIEETVLGHERSATSSPDPTEESVGLPEWSTEPPTNDDIHAIKTFELPPRSPSPADSVSPPSSLSSTSRPPPIKRSATEETEEVVDDENAGAPPRPLSVQSRHDDKASLKSTYEESELEGPPAAADNLSPAASTFPSESDFGGYYEEDLDIYDDYRYSRYSMMSRKSRKSVVPDPRSMPAMEAFPFKPGSLPNLTRLTESPVDRPSVDRTAAPPSPISLSSPRSVKSNPPLRQYTVPLPPTEPLRVQRKSKERSMDDSLISLSSPPQTPGAGPSRPGATLASSLRQQIEEELRQNGSSDTTVVSKLTAEPEGEQTVTFTPNSATTGLAKSPPTSPMSGISSQYSMPDFSPPHDDGSIPVRGTTPNRQPTLAISPPGHMSNVAEVAELAIPEASSPDSMSPHESALAQLEGRSPVVPSSPADESSFARQIAVEVGSTPFVSPSGRPLTFLPHPNAPKPVGEQTAPSQPYIYAVQGRNPNAPPPPQMQPQVLHNIMASAAALYFNPAGSPSVATIHGRTVADLGSASGPVPIRFFLDRDGRSGPPPTPHLRSPVPPPSPMIPPPATPIAAPDLKEFSPNSETEDASSASGPIPRPNFFPKTGGPRPRSRSFNGFTTSFVEVGLPIESAKKEAPEPSKGFRVPSLRSVRLSSKSSTPTTPVASTPRSSSFSARPSGKTPPPISVSRGSTLTSGLRSPPPSSPLARPPMSGVTTSDLGTTPKAASMLGSPIPSLLSPTSPRVALRNVASASALRSDLLPQSPQAMSPALASPISSIRSPPTSTSELRDQSGSPASNKLSFTDDESHKAPSIARSNSLRSKLSIAAIKSRAARGETPETGPSTPTAQFEFADETVQVKEGGAAAEFELVRPILPQVNVQPHSDDSHSEKEPASATDLDAESKRSESPVISLRLKISGTPVDSVAPSLTASPSDTASIESHRAREQKWLTAMSGTSSANARKNKKIKKLVQDGVPDSVRSVVWLYLTNSKARRMDGLYAQLCARGKVTASDDIQRDADRSFPSHPHLREPNGPIVSLLQAYLIMVPDIVYEQGLAAMAGTILLQAPEEDAFWTFMALMDNHLRGYYAQNSVQLIVDSRLLQRALESLDSALSKRLFVDLRVDPVELCKPWFCALFTNTLPNRFLYRVWDMFMCVAWIFRVSVTLLLSCKPFLMANNVTSNDALDYLFRPPAQVLPADPDAFVAAAVSVKLKEDDLKKQRGKIENAVKLQIATQTPRTATAIVQTKGLKAISGPKSAAA